MVPREISTASFIDGKIASPFCGSATQCETKNFWFSTLRARLGYAADRVLFYGTAGGALGDVAPGLSGNFQRITKGGWTAGAGVGFTENLTARIEYLYLKLGNCSAACLFGGTGGTAVSQERFTSQAQWFAALTGRVGYAANDWLFYAKGGGAWVNVSYTEDLLGLAAPTGGIALATQVITDNRTGFTVGAGIEFGLVENLSGKIEYDFYDFGSKSYNFNAITPVSVNSNHHTIIVGLNYKFNWSGGPKP